MMLTFLYRLYDSADNLLYIGITQDPNTRFRAHAADKSWWANAVRHQIEEVDTVAAPQIERDAIRAERPQHNIVHTKSDRVARRPLGRMPANLGEAPELLNEHQVASALGMSLEKIHHLEANDPTFPHRRPIPFAKVTKFRRTELQRWFTTAFPQEIGA